MSKVDEWMEGGERYRVKAPYPFYIQNEDREAQVKAYNEERDAIHALFEADCIAELGLTEHPKAELLFALAWGFGDEYEDIWRNAQKLAALL